MQNPQFYTIKEKLEIMLLNRNNILNNQAELNNKCRHSSNKYALDHYDIKTNFYMTSLLLFLGFQDTKFLTLVT